MVDIPTKEDILAALARKTLPKIRRYISPSGLEVMDVINAYDLSYSEGNILKYIIRKGAVYDVDGLSKAYWFTLQELQYHAKDPLARFNHVRRRCPSIACIADTFNLNERQTVAVRELLRKSSDAPGKIRNLLKVAATVKELIDNASASFKTEGPAGAKARSRQKKRWKKRP